MDEKDRYGDKKTRDFAQGKIHKKLRHIKKQAEKALSKLDAAENPGDVKAVSGHSFRNLQGEKWDYAVKINEKYCLCFSWDDHFGPYKIEITDHYEKL